MPGPLEVNGFANMLERTDCPSVGLVATWVRRERIRTRASTRKPPLLGCPHPDVCAAGPVVKSQLVV